MPQGMPGTQWLDPSSPLYQDQIEVERQRKIAEALAAQAGEPLVPNGTVYRGRVQTPIHWSQSLAKVVQAALAARQTGKADQAEKALAQQYSSKAAQAVQDYQRQSQGVPERAPAPVMPLNGQGPPKPAAGPPVPAVAADPRAAIMGLLANQYAPPEAKQAAIMGENWRRDDAEQVSKEQDRKDLLEVKRQELIDKRDKALQDSLDKRYTVDQNNALRRDLASYNFQLAQLTKAAQDGAKFQSTDAAGNITFYDRGGNPIAKHQGAGKPSATFEKAAADKKKSIRTMDEAITALEDITTAKDGKDPLLKQATGSGIGRGVDWTASLFGHATDGAIAVGKLQPIADIVLKMVPRFEGPQSDKDTQSYKEAAGQLSNPAIPWPQKQAAAETILVLMKARRNQFDMGDAGGSEAATSDEDWQPL